jgi:flagellar biosynthesis protein FlhF
MRLKIFEATSVTNAMEEIRRSLGKDAVIVDTETTTNGVRVSVAVEEPLSPPALGHSDGIDSLYEILERHSVSLAIIERLTGLALTLNTHDPLLALGAALDAAFSFQPIHIDQPQRLLLIGPAGQGKTVTAARLTARAVLSKVPVRLIAADIGRAGAMAQLSELCRPMGISPQTLEHLTVNTDGLTVIDGPAINPFDKTDVDVLAQLIADTDAEPLLVVAAGSDSAEAREIGMTFYDLGVRRFIATQLDATRHLGNVLSLADSGLALAAAGVGRTLADTLVSLNPLALARLFAVAEDHANRSSNREEEAA